MKKSDQLAPLAPRESKKIACADAVGVQAPVRFDSPAQIRTAPRTQAVSFRKPPDDPKHLLIAGTRLLRFRRWIRRRVVAVASAHRRISRRFHRHPDRAELAVEHGI